ncbi:hypothetical protein ACP4OV_011272 [Aristida adscensionis]
MAPVAPVARDHSYELALRRSLLLLRDLLGLLCFVARVLLDRLGLVPCDGDLQLPEHLHLGEAAAAAAERLLEAALWAPAAGTTTVAPRRRRRRAAVSAEASGGAGDDGGGGGGDAVCAICLTGLHEEAGGGDHQPAVAELRGCSHAFHGACIGAWVSGGEGATCPLCRAPVSPPMTWDDAGHDGQSGCQRAPRWRT